MLAVLAAMISESLIRINAIKNAISASANGVAALMFAAFAPVHWLFVPPLAAGFLLGGYTGPRLVRRLPVRALRVIVALRSRARGQARRGRLPVAPDGC